jgi:aspartate aminotransferase/aminotransferase
MEIIAANAVPRYYPLRLENNFKPYIRDLEEAVTPDTKVLLVNNPSNPSGSVFSESDCRELLDFALEHNLTILSDEVYDKIIYGVPFTPMASLNHPASVITVNSFSKTYAMTGWRIGYVAASTEICAQLVKMSEAFISCPSYISQKAAEAAVLGPQDFVHDMVAYYRRNRDLTSEMLLRSGLPYSVPDGAFYVMVDISSFGMDSETFAKKLLADQRVAVAPGITFGPLSDRFVRLGFCTETRELEKGLDRMLRFLASNSMRRK